MICDHQGLTGIHTLGHVKFIVYIHISVIVPGKSHIPNQTCVNYSKIKFSSHSLYRHSDGGNILTFSWSTRNTIYLIIVPITLEHNKINCTVQADHKKILTIDTFGIHSENSLHLWMKHFICRCTSKHFWVNRLRIGILMVTWNNKCIRRILPI